MNRHPVVLFIFLVCFSQGPRLLAPHNWAIVYRLNYNTRRLFARWQTLQIDYGRAGTDQVKQIIHKLICR